VYATVDDLKRRFAAAFLVTVADDDGDGVADTPLLEQALSDASALINLELGRRYAVPFGAPVPLMIGQLACVLAARNLARRSPATAGTLHRGDFADAEHLLARLAEGVVVLAGRGLLARAVTTLRDGQSRVFSREDLDGF
jgi:phage gp36-like protein